MKYGYDDDDDVMRTVVAVILGGVLMVWIALSCIGCASTKACPECIPEIKTVTVEVPVYSCPETEELPPLVLPEWPVFPEGGDEGQLKEFFSDCVATMKARERAFQEYIEMLKGILH